MKLDYQSSTVEGAEAFERMYGERSDFNEIDNDGDYDYHREEDDNEDYCGCSDPGCPCEGSKYGRL